jgi:exodeoxyribonuclease VII large subunit
MSKRATDKLAGLEARFAAVAPHNRLSLAKEQLSGLSRQLESLSYRSVLARGFSVTRDSAGQILRSVAQVEPGMTIQTELADGQFPSSTGILPVRRMGVPPMPPAPPPTGQPPEDREGAPAEPIAPKKAARKRDDDSPNLFDSFID